MQDVLWVPSDPTQFITWGADIRHYAVVPRDTCDDKARDDKTLQLSGTHVAVHVSTRQEPQYVRCVDVWPGDGIVLAAGQATGRISFISFKDGDGKFLVDRDLSPRTCRTCTAVAWYRASNSILASGYEKHRSDNALVVWDVSQGRMTDKPVVEFGLTDSCCSLTWFKSSPTMAAGMNGKFIRYGY